MHAPPSSCPTCGAAAIIKKGKNARGIQMFQCQSLQCPRPNFPAAHYEPQGQTPAARAAYMRAYRRTKALERLFLQVPCVQIGDHVTLYQGDARAIAPTLQHIHALITDPPYGIHFDFTKRRRSRTPLQQYSIPPARWDANVVGDDRPFDPIPWVGYAQVILWGANHYADRLPSMPGWLTWDKLAGTTPADFSAVEHAWTNLRISARLFSHLWRGGLRAGPENVVHGGKLHPAQKPVALMRWCVEKTTGTVLDPYMGSGSTGLACLELGRSFVGIELEPHYFTVARERLQAACAQGTLFPAPPRTP